MSEGTADGSRDATAPRHPIGVVATRTGLTPSALRAWERRYGVVEPARSEGGQRLYSDADVERLALLKRVSDAGRSIGEVAALEPPELKRLAREDEEAREAVARRERARAPTPGENRAAGLRERAMEAIRRLDGDTLEAVLRRGAAALGGIAFMEDVVAPLLRDVGEGWASGVLRPAHEHVATAVVRRVLSWLAEASGPGEGPAVVVGTLPGERHELGALLAATAASLEGWSVTYLGPDLPAEDLAVAAEGVGAGVVGVSVANPPNGEGSIEALKELRRRLAPDVLLVVGGVQAGEMEKRVEDPGVRRVGTLVAFRDVLRERWGGTSSRRA